MIEQNEDGGKRRNAAKKKELEATEKRIAELSAIFKRLYEDRDRKSTRLNSSHMSESRMPSSA